MKQRTLGVTGFEKFAEATRRAQFLAEMDRVVPWAEPCTVFAPVYPKASPAGGRPPITLGRLLRSYFLQQWFKLSDPTVEEALYDPQAMRSFAGVGLAEAAAPGETTACKFRQLLERHKLDKAPLGEVMFMVRRRSSRA